MIVIEILRRNVPIDGEKGFHFLSSCMKVIYDLHSTLLFSGNDDTVPYTTTEIYEHIIDLCNKTKYSRQSRNTDHAQSFMA